MESSDSMCDNRCDDDTPLKQVVQLCSILAGKGLQFSISVRSLSPYLQGKRRSPSYLRQAGKKEVSEEEARFRGSL